MGLLTKAQEIFGDKTFKGNTTFEGEVFFKSKAYWTKEVGYAPTFSGWGTVSNVTMSWQRVANRVKVMGKFTSGTFTAVELRISLPNGIVSDSTLIPSIEMCGLIAYDHFSASYFALYAMIEPGVSYITVGMQSNSNSPFTKITGALLVNSSVFSVQFELPVSGWN